MLYKFLHKDGYEATIKDIDTFISFVNDGGINKDTIVFDEEKLVGKKAKDVNEFNDIFSFMEHKGWSLYIVPKPVEKNEKSLNIIIDEDKERKQNIPKGNGAIYTNKKLPSKENVVSKYSKTTVNMSKDAKLFFTISATFLIILSFVLIFMSGLIFNKIGSSEDDKYLMLNVIFLSGIIILVAAISARFIFKKNIFVAYLCFAIIIFFIASILFVDSYEKKRDFDNNMAYINNSAK